MVRSTLLSGVNRFKLLNAHTARSPSRHFPTSVCPLTRFFFWTSVVQSGAAEGLRALQLNKKQHEACRLSWRGRPSIAAGHFLWKQLESFVVVIRRDKNKKNLCSFCISAVYSCKLLGCDGTIHLQWVPVVANDNGLMMIETSLET